MPEPQQVGDILATQPVLPPPAENDSRFRFRGNAGIDAHVTAHLSAEATTRHTDPARPVDERPTVALDEVTYLIRRRAELTTQIDSLTGARDLIDGAIKTRLGDAQVGTVHGKPLVRWTISTPSRLDQRRLKAEHPDVWQACLTVGEQRTFTVDTDAVLKTLGDA